MILSESTEVSSAKCNTETQICFLCWDVSVIFGCGCFFRSLEGKWNRQQRLDSHRVSYYYRGSPGCSSNLNSELLSKSFPQTESHQAVNSRPQSLSWWTVSVKANSPRRPNLQSNLRETLPVQKHVVWLLSQWLMAQLHWKTSGRTNPD